MNRNLQRTLWIANWEFWRYFKIKQELFTMAMIFFVMVAVFASSVVRESEDESKRLVVIGDATDSLMTLAGFDFERRPAAALDQARAQLFAREIAGVLAIPVRDDEPFQLWVMAEPPWVDALRQHIDGHVRKARLRTIGWDERRLAWLLTPAQLAIHRLDQPDLDASARASAKWTAYTILGMSAALFMSGGGLFFMSITGEKKQRLSEQIISAVSPQIWIDGKILGLTIRSLCSLISIGIYGIIGSGAWMVANQRFEAVDPNELWRSTGLSVQQFVIIIAFAALGLIFWNCCIAALAATVDDPDHSMRTTTLLLPLVPPALGLWVADDLTSVVAHALAYFPLTSMIVMPLRVAAEHHAAWEPYFGIALLILATVWARKAAARIFAAGMMMYGKEPSLREMAHWLSAKPKSSS